jgi:hypothetical protein
MRLCVVTLCACMIALPMAASAQGEPGPRKSSLGANFEVSIPTDDLFKEVAGTGYGGNLRYPWGADARTAVTVTAGYLAWGKKDLGLNTSVESNAFNIFVGGKYYLAEGLYGSLEGGFYFLSYTYEGTVVGALASTAWFMLPIGIGYQKSGFEIGARYMLLAADYHSFSFTLGYNFML